jgi:hypothetical protein
MTAVTKEARKLAVTSETVEGGAIVITATLKNGDKIGYSLNTSDTQLMDFAAYGITKKIREVVAGVADDKYGEVIKEMFDAFAEGKWSAGRSGDAEPTGGYLAKAIAQLSGKTLAEANDFVQGLTPETRKAMEKNDLRVVKVINELRAAAAEERAKKAQGDAAVNAQSSLDAFLG